MVGSNVDVDAGEVGLSVEVARISSRWFALNRSARVLVSGRWESLVAMIGIETLEISRGISSRLPGQRLECGGLASKLLRPLHDLLQQIY